MFTDRTMTNPLLDVIFEILSTGTHYKVHELAAQITSHKALPNLDSDPHKELFKKNFLIMNALYQLQNELHEYGHHLHVSNMDIYLHQAAVDTPNSNAPQVESSAALRHYYLDWSNYETSEEDIEALLTSFWQKYLLTTPSLGSEARAQLQKKWQLPTQYSATELQKRWRQLAIENHPDKGGDAAIFKQIKQEYEQLKSTL
ncbi:DNA-J related domain-containing protein [Pseudoalteromonas luteoviolacea]|nr:DNA-J related domain-containing protein [Pseudoalteromonas luteoviolacea]